MRCLRRVSLVTGVVFGLAPALKATRVDLLQTLRDEGLQPIDHRRLTLKNALIVFQVAVSVLLLGGTSIFLQAAAARERCASAMPWTAWRCSRPTYGLPATRRTTRGGSTTICGAGSRRFRASNPPRCCAACRWNPMACRSSLTARRSNGIGSGSGRVAAGPGFFDTLRIPLLHGRVFDARDRADTPRVAVITDRMARQYFGAVDAVGRRFRLQNDPELVDRGDRRRARYGHG